MINETVGLVDSLEPKKPALGQVIKESLNSLVERSSSVTLQLEEFERYLFGMREADKGTGTTSEEQSECWKTNIIELLDRVHAIITDQEKSLEIISNFNN